MSDTSNNFQSTLGISNARRVRLQREGSLLTGVCSGISAAFDLDVNLIRVGWVTVSLISPLGFIAYTSLAFLLPADEQLDAAGARPFFDGAKLIKEVKRGARELMKASLQSNPRVFRGVWRRGIINIRRAWKEAIQG